MNYRPALLSTALLIAAAAPCRADEPASRPQQAMDAQSILEGLESHDRALHITTGWIRDPFITIGPDGLYYLTGTTPNEVDPRNEEEPYNTGLDFAEQELHRRPSIVGHQVRVWTSPDLVEWTSLGVPFDLADGYWARKQPAAFEGDRDDWRLWAPEVHFINGKWHLVHTTPAPVRGGANVAVSEGNDLAGPWAFPLGDLSRNKHDPSLFEDDDGTVYLLWGNTMIAPLTKDMSAFAAEPVRIDPSTERPAPDGNGTIRRIGHEGATMIKIGDTYVHLGTAWSTDRGRMGSYNLYYCESKNIMGPYGERKFAGRFLGHGTPFQDQQGRWWCTAFYNADVPPLSREEARDADLGDDAKTINEQGVTIVPLEVRQEEDGSVFIRAIDPDYRNPGPDEVQYFQAAPPASPGS